MAVVRLFAAAREAAGTGRAELPGDTVADVLAAAVERYGPSFADLLPTCRVWVNGDAVDDDTAVGPGDEVAVLPPVSGGADDGLDHVRVRRAELQRTDDVLSYVRRVAQARADLARAERHRRRAAIGDDITDGLRDVLSDRLLGPSGANRPPRPAEDHSDDPRAIELDQRCARLGFGRLDELADEELDALVADLDGFESRTSAERQAVHGELDALTEQLVDQYRDRYVGSTDEEDG